MYLSRVFLQPRKLNNAYEWHRALWSLFPNIERGSVSPFLYYVESLNLLSGAQLLLQSSIEPIAYSSQAKVLVTKPYPVHFEVGQRLAFQLLANPTKCITDTHHKVNKKNHGKCRVPLIKEEEQRHWLQRKFAEAAHMGELTIRNHAPLYFHKGNRAGKVIPVLFEGTLSICNDERMAELSAKGIGPAKAFGCGMLLVRRA